MLSVQRTDVHLCQVETLQDGELSEGSIYVAVSELNQFNYQLATKVKDSFYTSS